MDNKVIAGKAGWLGRTAACLDKHSEQLAGEEDSSVAKSSCRRAAHGSNPEGYRKGGGVNTGYTCKQPRAHHPTRAHRKWSSNSSSFVWALQTIFPRKSESLSEKRL
jgi:hypothetical protein